MRAAASATAARAPPTRLTAAAAVKVLRVVVEVREGEMVPMVVLGARVVGTGGGGLLVVGGGGEGDLEVEVGTGGGGCLVVEGEGGGGCLVVDSTGQTVVETATVTVMYLVEEPGHTVTAGGQLTMVEVEVVKMVLVVH